VEDGAHSEAVMSRRVLAVVALVVASSSLTACADSVTAPREPTLAPSTSHESVVTSSTCKGGYILSEGRCR